MRSAWVMSELWTMALNNMHPCRFSLKLFVVTFVLTYTFIHFTFRQHFTSSKSGIISCTSRCYQGSRIIGKDKTKTEIWENKPLTQRMLLLHPSAVPHLSRLQPPLSSASWIEGGQLTMDNGHCEVNENEYNLVPRYFESMQNDMRLSFFISKQKINLKEYLVNAFPHGIEGDIEI